MPRVVHLVTLVDVAEGGDVGGISASMPRAVRGWTEELRGAGANRIDDLWALTPERDIVETARMVVGPDEPFRGRSQDEMETDHWNALAENLRAHGVVVDAGELRQLPHDVVLSDRLRARLPHSPGGAA